MTQSQADLLARVARVYCRPLMRPFAQLFAAFLFGFVLTGCARKEATNAVSGEPGVTRAPRKVVLQSDWFPQAEHGGYYQALAKGFYADAGLDVEIWPGGPGAGIKLKVARGDADFGMQRSDDLILAVSRSMPLVMVAATMQHDPLALMVHADSPVKTFRDLDGRAVVGNVGMAWFPYLESKHGIRIERRQNTYGLGEFLANREMIQQCLVTNEPFFAAQKGRQVRTMVLSDAGYDCYQGLFTRRELIRQSPEVVRAFVHASIRGWRSYLENDPTPANEMILKRNSQMTRELLDFSRAALISHRFVHGDPAKGEDIGQVSLARLEEQIRTLLELKILEKSVAIAEVATTEFLPPPLLKKNASRANETTRAN
jgi:NitT/TauT family transport system substrate-binding protein